MFRKELLYYFTTPVAYIVIGLYLLIIFLFLWVIPGEWNIIDSGYSQVDGLFRLSPWLFLFMCPALTMRLFSEERQNGTWDLLRTKPISLHRIVIAKFMAAWVLVVISISACLIHYMAVYFIAEPVGNIDSAAFFAAFFGLMLISLSFIAIGTFASSFSTNQIVCFILSVIACAFFYYGFDLLASLFHDSATVTFIEHIGGYQHFLSISRGVIEIKDLAYFLIVAVFFLSSTIYKLK